MTHVGDLVFGCRSNADVKTPYKKRKNEKKKNPDSLKFENQVLGKPSVPYKKNTCMTGWTEFHFKPDYTVNSHINQRPVSKYTKTQHFPYLVLADLQTI